MKIFLLFISCFLTSLALFSQTHPYGALFSGMIIKSDGRIIISENDPTVVLTSIVDGIEKSDEYPFVKKSQ